MERFDVVIVGAGLVGAALAYDLGARGARVVVLEKEAEPAAGASRSNSGVVHTGFDSRPGEFETDMILAQATRWHGIFDGLGIPYRETGALLVAVDDDEASRLPGIAENAAQNGVEVDLLGEKEAKRLEPGSAAVAGLLVPGESITDPYEVVRRMLASSSNVGVRLSWPVSTVEPRAEDAVVAGPSGKVSADFVLNCAGLFVDDLAGDRSFRIVPRRGEFAVFGKGTSELVRRILLPVPNPGTKGVLVFPTLYGHLCAGPSAVDQKDKEDWQPREEGLAFVKERGARLLPALWDLRQTDSWAGLRPAGQARNYVLGWSERMPAMYNVAAIRSTGLSSCLGLSEHVVSLLAERGLEFETDRHGGRTAQGHAAPILDGDPPRPWWERLNALRRVSTA